MSKTKVNRIIAKVPVTTLIPMVPVTNSEGAGH